MSDVLVRNIPEEALARLKQRAVRKHRSLQQELQRIITSSAHDELDELVDRVRERRARYGAAGRTLEDSTRMIRRDRSR